MKNAAQIRLLKDELDQYYSSYDSYETQLLPGLAQRINALSQEDSFARKTAQIEYMTQACPVHIFRHTPLFFEIASGRPRHSWGGFQSPVGAYLNRSTADHWLTPYADALQKDREEGFMHGWNNPVGLDHHVPGYDNLLALGVEGIIRKAEDALSTCTHAHSRSFYRSVIHANRALLDLAHRFADKARELAAQAEDESSRLHYEKIAETAQVIPAQPPRTFYEALELILFYRECVGSLEGIGFSSFAQLDRMLCPYYRADIAAGHITPEEAEALICDLLIYTDVRFETDRGYYETSTTIELGGCDRAGEVIFNEMTEMILRAVMAVRSIGTKINCRISSRHPKAYLDLIAQVQLANLPCVMMHNDDVLIPARVKLGQAEADARLYVGCGCHEVVLSGSEVCTRADTWISLPRLLLRTLAEARDHASFEDFYAAYMADVRAYHARIIAIKNEGESHWCEFAPLPLYSSSLTGPLDSGKDVTEGGAKYNTTALSMLGAATLIDSLYSVKHLVFDERKLSLAQLSQIVSDNFENQEELRQYIIRKIPKHGTNDNVLNAFSRRVLHDLSGIAGQKNARGGDYLPAFYPHDIYRHLGLIIGATPDGRSANTPLSRGVSPSEFVESSSPLDIIHSLRCIDFTKFADSFIAEITLPQLEANDQSRTVLTAIMQAFLDAGGSSIQFNLINRDLLLDAMRHPQQHKNLFVRVCGYSAAFIYLNEETQREVVSRSIR